MKVVTDASPLNYLVLINAEHVLPKLFGEVLAPAAVIEELTHVRTPTKVREWASAPPTWLRVMTTAGGLPDEKLGPGESAEKKVPASIFVPPAAATPFRGAGLSAG
jgi:predicted nucleic acid-binding protein